MIPHKKQFVKKNSGFPSNCVGNILNNGGEITGITQKSGPGGPLFENMYLSIKGDRGVFLYLDVRFLFWFK